MKLNNKEQLIYTGQRCPYCNSPTRKVPMEFVYGRVYSDGRDLICCNNYPKCDSYVGTHADGTALGRLANKDLRRIKREAHNSFDRIWKEGHIKRKDAYKKLSNFLKLPREYTHIGMFKRNTCNKVIIWADALYNKLTYGK